MKAWRTTLIGIDSIVLAETRAKAKAATIRAAREAGYGVDYTSHCRALRVHHLDALPVDAGRVLSPDYVMRMIGGGS